MNHLKWRMDSLENCNRKLTPVWPGRQWIWNKRLDYKYTNRKTNVLFRHWESLYYFGPNCKPENNSIKFMTSKWITSLLPGNKAEFFGQAKTDRHCWENHRLETLQCAFINGSNVLAILWKIENVRVKSANVDFNRHLNPKIHTIWLWERLLQKKPQQQLQ